VKRPGYREAVRWIADNDSPGDGAGVDELRGFVTVGFVADLFDVDQEKVAEDVFKARARERRGASW
jgi:hypothetical protein